MPIEVPWKPNGKHAFVARHSPLYLYVKSGIDMEFNCLSLPEMYAFFKNPINSFTFASTYPFFSGLRGALQR